MKPGPHQLLRDYAKLLRTMIAIAPDDMAQAIGLETAAQAAERMADEEWAGYPEGN